MANVAEDLLVEVEPTFVHAAPPLALGAHAEHGFEPLELGHRLPVVEDVGSEFCLYFHKFITIGFKCDEEKLKD